MPSYENFFTFEYWQYEVIRHMFGMTSAAFFAGLAYFVLSTRRVLPRFRLSLNISAVIMASAFIALTMLMIQWATSFTFDAGTQTFSLADEKVFSNGYRYVNWIVTVPLLLTQFLLTLGFRKAEFFKRLWPIVIAAELMLITGYIGQYSDGVVAGFLPGDGMGFWLWGGISWLFFFFMLYQVFLAYNVGKATFSDAAQSQLKWAWVIILVTWFTYGFAYMIPGIPGINESTDWVVIRQIAYTFADVFSKAVFGVVLCRVAMLQSQVEDPRYTDGEPELALAAKAK